MRSSKEYKVAARNELSGYWTMPVLATLVYSLISSICSTPNIISGAFPTSKVALIFSGIAFILTILVLLPLAYGLELSFLKFLRGSKEDTVERMFDGFKTYGRAIGVSILTALFVMLWTFLFIIPGIIKSFAYSMTIYISKDHPELSANECIDRSVDMMRGHKWDLFVLFLSFIGWFLLCLLTFGIGLLWLIPYVNVSVAAFYEDLKAEEEAALAKEAEMLL